MKKGSTFVGLDAHKKFISVAMLLPGEKQPVEWQVANQPAEIRRLTRKLSKKGVGEIRCCYEAGPLGYGLKRQLETGGEIICEVIAPALIPIKVGDRVKTDSRDARKLAELLRAGLLTEVRAPTPEEESVRDLTRCRADAKQDQTRARHRLSKFLLRRDLNYTGNPWTQAHSRWLSTMSLEQEADRAVFDDYVRAIELVGERLKALDEKIEALSKREPFATPVAWLRCFHGIDTTTAMIIVTELHDIRRFESARSLMAYLGLVPSEHSSGGREVRGAITKAGNQHLRRVLVEAAHHVRHQPRIGPTLRKRRAGAPGAAINIADRAHVRLHRRYWRLVNAGKQPNKARVAVARELAGFIWGALIDCQRAAEPKAPPAALARASAVGRPEAPGRRAALAQNRGRAGSRKKTASAR